MRIYNNKIVPEFVVNDKLELIPFDDLTSKTRRFIYNHSQHISFLTNRPFMRRKLEQTFTIMKQSGGFTGKEFKEIVRRAEEKGLIVQWDVQRIHGGSQGTKSPGKIDVGETQVVMDIMREHNMEDAYNELSMGKRMDRIHKIDGPIYDFLVKPKVKIGREVDHKLEGLIFADEKWMEKCGIPYGAKTTFITKGLLIPTKLKDCDIVIPQNENKWNFNEEELSELMRWRPDQSPEYAFSKNLHRWPTARFDLLSLLDKVPGKDFSVYLDEPKEIYETGTISSDAIHRLFGYETSKGKILRDEGLRLLLGDSIYNPDIWPNAKQALMTWILSELQPSFGGFYGIIMPMDLLPKGAKKQKVWFTRWPWLMPIKTVVGIHEHCIFIDEDLVKLFGGDYDRDQGCCYYEGELNNGYEWPKDKKELELLFALPIKEDEKFDTNWNEYDVISYQLDQYNGCGLSYNNAQIALQIAKSKGYSKEQIREMSIVLSSKIVQPFIDGFKYKGSDKPPRISEMLKMLKVDHVRSDIEKHSDLFRIWRSKSTSLDNLIDMAQLVPNDATSFYEKILLMFKGWKKGKYNALSVKPEIDAKVKQSYITHMDAKDVQQARYKELMKSGASMDYVCQVLASCWKRNDVGLARVIMNNIREAMFEIEEGVERKVENEKT